MCRAFFVGLFERQLPRWERQQTDTQKGKEREKNNTEKAEQHPHRHHINANARKRKEDARFVAGEWVMCVCVLRLTDTRWIDWRAAMHILCQKHFVVRWTGTTIWSAYMLPGAVAICHHHNNNNNNSILYDFAKGLDATRFDVLYARIKPIYIYPTTIVMVRSYGITSSGATEHSPSNQYKT